MGKYVEYGLNLFDCMSHSTIYRGVSDKSSVIFSEADYGFCEIVIV